MQSCPSVNLSLILDTQRIGEGNINYEYECDECQKFVEIIKSMNDSGRVEHCPTCGTVMTRIFTSPQIVGAKVAEAEFNPGLGCVVKNKQHREEIAKRKGLIEIGNERPSSMQKLADRTLKENLARTWEKD